MTRIAQGEIEVKVSDERALADLERLKSEFERTMAKIGREKAVAEITAEMSGVEDAVNNTRRKLKQLDGERAEVELGVRKGDIEKIDAEIAKQKQNLRSLDGLKAEMEIDLKGAEKALAAEAALKKADDDRARSFEKNEANRQRVLDQSARREDQRARQNLAQVQRVARTSQALERQRAKEMIESEREAYKLQHAREVGIHQETAKVAGLQKEYARLTDRMERIAKQRPIGREARAKVTLNAAETIAKMEALKKTLEFMGSHPPVQIKADIDRRGFRAKAKGFFADIATTIGGKAAGLGDMTLRLGPFTSSIKGAITALGILGPSLTDVLGAAGALVGVLGAGIAGAATIGAGAISGMGLATLGLMFSTRNTRQEITQARTSINAYQSALLKYGASSDKTKKKQEEMNHVLAHISPLAREAALGTEQFFRGWDRSTKATQGNLGTIAKDGFAALNAIRPMWAARVNEMSGLLAHGLSGAFKFMRGPEARGLLDGIMQDFNREIPTILHALGSIGHAFLIIAREGASHLHMLTGGFDNLASRLLGFTQRDDFGATVKRWATYAQDVMRFFGALTRVVVHFFGIGSSAGDDFVKTMTNALNRWDDFIQSSKGQSKIGDYFRNSVAGTQELYAALKPLIELFALWAVGLEPAVTMITRIFSWVTKATAAVGKLVGLQNPLATFGATLGAMWAVGKIGAFVSFLARAVELMRELGAVGTLKSIFTGNFLGQLRGGGTGIQTAGAAAAAEMRAGIIQGGTAVAAELRAALASGGAAAGAEGAAASLLGPTGKPIRAAERVGVDAAETAAGGAAASRAAGGFNALRTAVTGVGAAFGIEGLAASTLATGGLAIVAGAAVYGAYKLLTMKSASEKLRDSIHGTDKATQAYGKQSHELVGTMTALGTETNNYNQSVGRVAGIKAHLNKLEASGKKNTDEYRMTLEQLNQALTDRATHERNVNKLYDNELKLTGAASKLHANELTANQRLNEARQKRSDLEKRLYEQGYRGVALQNALSSANKDVARAEASATAAHREYAAAQDRAILATLNYQRGLHGLIPVAGAAARALVALNKRAPNVAAQINVKYADPKDAAAVAARASSALKGGVPARIVTKIVADSKSAEDAIRRLQRATLSEKVLKIVERGGDAAVKMLEKILGRKLTPKEQRIAEQGGANVLSRLRTIAGTKLSNKTLRAIIQDLASGKLSSIRALIDSLHDKTVTLSVNERHTVTNLVKKVALGHASGRGRKMKRSTALVGEGRAPEWLVDPKTGMAEKVAGAQMRTLAPSQYVIPTEPKYKKRGRDLLAGVAKDLGIPGYRGGRAPAKAAPKTPKVESTFGGVFKGAEFFPKAVLSRKDKTFEPADKSKRYSRKKFLSERGWANYVTGLQTQQDYWEREVSIRESQVREPADMAIRDPASDYQMTDPTTGDTVTVEAYKANPAIESEYKPDMANVLTAMQTLMSIVAELVRAIPQAIAANRAEHDARRTSIGVLNSEIGKEEHRLEAAKKGKKAGRSDRVARHEAQIKKLRDERDKHIEANKGLKEDEKVLDAARVDAGFDYREEDIARASLQREYDTASGAAAAEASQETNANIPTGSPSGAGNGPGDGPGGAASGPEGLSYGAQQAALSSEKANVYNQFAGNTFQNMGANVAQAVGQGVQQGMTANAAAFGSVGQAISSGAAAGAAVAQSVASGSVAQAISSGSAAAGAMSTAPSSGVAASVGGGSTTVNKTVNVVNNNAAPPADPHTWSQNVAFELNTAV